MPPPRVIPTCSPVNTRTLRGSATSSGMTIADVAAWPSTRTVPWLKVKPAGAQETGKLLAPSVRAALDRASVIKLHGRWVDVSRFAHPGGPAALGLGFGRDATALFESSHPFTARGHLAAQVAALEVRDPASVAYLDAKYARELANSGNVGGPYDFDFSPAAVSLRRSGASAADSSRPSGSEGGDLVVDPFEADVKAAALAYFRGEAARRGVSLRTAMKATPARVAEVAVLGVAFACSAVALVRGSWPALFLAPTLCWLWMVNFWHDAAHFAWSQDWRINVAATYAAPWFSSPLMWAHQHTIGHHSYPNVPGRDPDLYHAPEFWRFTSSLRWRSEHEWQALATPFMWPFAVPTLLLLKPLVALFNGAFNRTIYLARLPAWRVALHILGRVGVFCSLYVWPWWAFADEPLKAAAFAFVPMGLFSFYFMACSQVNHHDEVLSSAHDKRWYRHQVATSHTIAPRSRLVFLASGGLNLQIEHHMFPTVNHCHLRALQVRACEGAAKVSLGEDRDVDWSAKWHCPLFCIMPSISHDAHPLPPHAPCPHTIHPPFCMTPTLPQRAPPPSHPPHPTILQPAIEAAARKHNVPYLCTESVSTAFIRLWAHLWAMGQKPAAQSKSD